MSESNSEDAVSVRQNIMSESEDLSSSNAAAVDGTDGDADTKKEEGAANVGEEEESELLQEDDEAVDEGLAQHEFEVNEQLQEDEEDFGEEETQEDQCHAEFEENPDSSMDPGEEVVDEAEGAGEGEEGHEEGKEEDDEEDDAANESSGPNFDPNIMPQVNVQTLAKRKWQVKVYPLRASDFTSGAIAKVFRGAKESLLYLISAGKYSLGKGEMYITSVYQTLKVVQSLMKRDSSFQDVNLEIVKKNDNGVVEEKAYMRFDSNLVRLLFNPTDSSYSWGRKRERIIGSIFVKNLPANTSKDMLRVMFPFAQEINYNPEKFKEGTARLVLKSRSSVIPCLKAFVKVELGGQVLELHPLEKKRAGHSTKAEPSRSRSTSVQSDEGKVKSEDGTKKEVKPETICDGKKDSASTKKSEDAKVSSASEKKPMDRKRSGPPPSKRDPNGAERRERSDLDRPKKVFNKYDPNRGRGRGGYRGRSDSYRSRGFVPRGRRGAIRGTGDRRPTSSYREDTSPRNADATKDMLVLQNQLSMAIKSQLAVLNQTKMAVHQAKIEAATTSGMLSGQMSDLDRGYDNRAMSRDRREAGASYSQKRKAHEAGLRQHGDRGYGKRAYKGKGGPSHMRTSGRGGSRASGYDDAYRRELEAEDDYRRELYSRAEELRSSRSSYGGLGSGSYSHADYYDY